MEPTLLYDTTLRDGTQGEGVALSLVDKLKIARKLDEVGFDYIEGGYPLSNPKDAAFFAETAGLDWQHAKICAFGMTRRSGRSVANDPGLSAVLNAGTPAVCLVGKTWDFHVDVALGVTPEEHLKSIADSIAAIVIGGTSLSGGRGTILGTVIGCLIIGVLNSGLVLLNVSPFWQQVVKGAVILIAVAIDRLRENAD